MDFDVLIVGAGLVGCSLALALQGHGLRIALMDKRLPDFKSPVFRPLSLSYASVMILKTLGIWDALIGEACPIRGVHVSEEGAWGSLYFQAAEYGVEALGYVVSLSTLHQCLYQAVCAQAGVQILSGDVGEMIRDPQVLPASLVVGCDGTHSRVRQLFHFPVQQQQGKAVAFTALVDLANPVSVSYLQVAFERFTRDGVFGLLPWLSTNKDTKEQCGLVWTMSPSQAASLQTASEAQVMQEIARHGRRLFPVIEQLHQSHWLPLITSTSPPQLRPGVVLIGNAAHTLYPLAAQGFNLGLRDVAVLAEVVIDAYQAQQEIGHIAVLERYHDWRLPDQKKMMRLTQGIHRATSTVPPRIRGVGLGMIDLIPTIKRRIAHATMGLSGKLPKLVRGVPLW